MPRAILGLAAFLLASCGGGGEVYPVSSKQAYLELSSIGTPPAMDPLPGGLSPVSVTFEVIPGENSVQWLFTHEGDDIGRIVAKVTPDGAASPMSRSITSMARRRMAIGATLRREN